jgi:hypothetical protein
VKVYQYLAKPPVTDPQAIERQLRLAVDYQRALTQVEIDRRRAVEKVYVDALPAEHAACAEAERAAEAAATALRAARSYQAIKAPKGDEDASADVREARAMLLSAREAEKAARETKRVARKALTPSVKPSLRALDRDAYAARKRLYNALEYADLAWGTKLAVGESVERASQAAAKEGTLPKMPTFDGSGAVAVQLQGGLSPADVAEDTRFRLEVVDRATWIARQQAARRARYESQIAAGVKRVWKDGNGVVGNDGRPLPDAEEDRGQYAFAHLRIGSEGRAPVWASWPVRVTRPLPENGVIKWARAQATKIGTRVDWTILVTVDEPEVAPRDKGYTLAVNLGWRNLEDGGIRVAYAVGSDGREEEVRVPERFLSKIAHVEHLRSIRDRLCDEAHAALRDWITGRTTGPDEIPVTDDDLDAPDGATVEHDGALYERVGDSWRRVELPEWFTEATRWIANWRGPKQIARLLREWEVRRVPTCSCQGVVRAGAFVHNKDCVNGIATGGFAGDEAIFQALATWRNGKDADGHSVGNHHLRFWESDEREKAYRHRNEVYRQIARRWAREYARVIVTDMDLRDFAEEPAPEKGRASGGSRQRRTRTLAGPSILRGEVARACASAGSVFEEQKGAATRTCAACGVERRFDARHLLRRTCTACGKEDDQDRNHCKVLLASASVMKDHGGPLAPVGEHGEKERAERREGRWKRRRSRNVSQVVDTDGVSE